MCCVLLYLKPLLFLYSSAGTNRVEGLSGNPSISALSGSTDASDPSPLRPGSSTSSDHFDTSTSATADTSKPPQSPLDVLQSYLSGDSDALKPLPSHSLGAASEQSHSDRSGTADGSNPSKSHPYVAKLASLL